MDAVKFLQERSRMYESGAATPGIGLEDDYDPVIAVKVVENWSAANPRKTRQDVFLEQYPEARVDDIGVLRVCPAIVSTAHRGDKGGCSDISKECAVCRKEFWTKVVDAQPSVNVTGIARGRWTNITRVNDGERMIATCSCCKDRGDVRTTKTGLGLWKLDSPYCPNCGVKMQEVE